MAPTARRRTAAVAVGGLAVWQVSVDGLGVPAYVLASPLAVATYIGENFQVYLADLTVTAKESVLALLLSVAAALLVFVASTKSITFMVAARSTSSVLQSVPILAVAPFLTAWFGPDLGAKVAASALVCLPAVVNVLLSELQSIPTEEIWFGRSVFRSDGQFYIRFLFPRIAPALVASLRIAAPLACLGAIVGEFVGSSEGLGFRILTGSYYLRTSEMLAGVLGTVAMSLSLVALADLAGRRAAFWSGKRLQT